VACGDGSIKLYDTNIADFPVMNFHEHKRETFSVVWSPVTKDTFASSSWDGTVKIVSAAVHLDGAAGRWLDCLPHAFPVLVVASKEGLDKNPPGRELYIQHLLLPLQSSYNLCGLHGLASPHLRPADAG
jgi:WD40 repeat protein